MKGRDGNANQANLAFTSAPPAIGEGHTDTVLVLLAGEADVNARGSGGWTALMHAATKGQTDIVQALLDQGADVNAKTDDGWTALRMALGEGHSSTVPLLREAEVSQ